MRLAYVDQGYTGEAAADAAAAEGIELHVVKLPEVKRGSFCCHNAGSWNDLSRGQRAAVGWSKTTSAMPRHLQSST